MATAEAEASLDVADRLYIAGETPLHRLPAQTKIIAAVLFVLIVVATPATFYPAFAWYALLIVLAAFVAGLGPRRLLPRMAVEIPFVLFAVLLPVLGRPPMVEVFGIALSQPGLAAAWNILAKATLGVAAAVVLSATTRPRDLIDGLGRLPVPALLVEIAAFMLRYLQVVTEEWRRMATARAARGYTARGPRSWPVQARSAGVLFIRSYERGERVHVAMRARGYQGSMPDLASRSASAAQWALALSLPAVAVAGSLVLWAVAG